MVFQNVVPDAHEQVEKDIEEKLDKPDVKTKDLNNRLADYMKLPDVKGAVRDKIVEKIAKREKADENFDTLNKKNADQLKDLKKELVDAGADAAKKSTTLEKVGKAIAATVLAVDLHLDKDANDRKDFVHLYNKTTEALAKHVLDLRSIDPSLKGPFGAELADLGTNGANKQLGIAVLKANKAETTDRDQNKWKVTVDGTEVNYVWSADGWKID